jgi:hypothetical protein
LGKIFEGLALLKIQRVLNVPFLALQFDWLDFSLDQVLGMLVCHTPVAVFDLPLYLVWLLPEHSEAEVGNTVRFLNCNWKWHVGDDSLSWWQIRKTKKK